MACLTGPDVGHDLRRRDPAMALGIACRARDVHAISDLLQP